MKTAFVASFALTDSTQPKKRVAKAEPRPRSTKMDLFLRQVNGSPRYNVVNIAAEVSAALEQSKKTG